MYTEEEFKNAKGNDFLLCKCEYCKNNFFIEKFKLFRIKDRVRRFCSLKCAGKYKDVKIDLFCKNCNFSFRKRPKEIDGYKNNFCSQSCSTTFNNKNKIIGYRRSKLEAFIENELTKSFPSLEIHFNKKNTISCELDIYIPSIKLAFELNGIFHYKPIYGVEKLEKVKNNDIEKINKCSKLGIKLHIIDVSKQGHFNRTNSIQYLNFIIDEINNAIS